MSYKYYIYGLNVESDIEIEEAYRKDFSEAPDVRIVIGSMPPEIQKMYADKTESDDYVAFSNKALAFRIPNLADYHVTKDVITVNPFKNAVHNLVKSFLLGSCFGYGMILRGQLVMHGGGICKYGKGVIVTGESGAGKSTVSDSLLSSGYAFVADDVCAISEKDGKPHINMAYPQQKLCRDAALNKGYDLSELIYINEDRDKFAIRLKDGYLPEGAQFNYLFELVLSDDDKLSFKEITGHEKLMLLMRNIYRGEDGLNTWGVPPEYMKLCLNAASQVEIYQIARPKNLNTLPDIVKFIEEKVKGE